MPDPTFEVLMNGTVVAEQAGQISPDDADRLRKEMQEAAALEVAEDVTQRYRNTLRELAKGVL
jgi:hypothetical protein